jgi:tetraacyldisaccharide 4'-kinase
MFLSRDKFFFKLKKQFIFKPSLVFISFFLKMIVKFRNLLFDKKFLKIKKLPGQSISIGNITLGGSGKSPFLLFLLEKFSQEGRNVAVLTRGYKSGVSRKEVVLLKEGGIYFLKGDPRKISPDEALMYSYRFPHVPIIVSPSRFKAATAFLEKNLAPDIWILDDGFQHRQIHRDLDIVLHDVSLNLEDKIFPEGFLREPFLSLKRCDIFIATHRFVDEKCKNAFLQKLSFFLGERASCFQLEFFNEKPKCLKTGVFLKEGEKDLVLICGIAQPDKFLRYAESLGLLFKEKFILDDHSSLSLKDKKLIRQAKNIFTTEKDYYREKSFFDSLESGLFISRFLVNHKKIKRFF